MNHDTLVHNHRDQPEILAKPLMECTQPCLKSYLMSAYIQNLYPDEYFF